MIVASSHSLLGIDVGQAAARLGPPMSCVVVGDEVHLGYLGESGELVPDGVVLVDGVVVRARRVRRSPPALHAYWIGQPIERLLSNFGPVLASVPGAVLQELTFAAFRVCVHEGRVVLVAPRSLTRAS
ncbi:MAG: hypothetical protein JNK15_13475 [Planctomycetes bacterium]|nr:hypothetical protein [Planctomycetota bacterium]